MKGDVLEYMHHLDETLATILKTFGIRGLNEVQRMAAESGLYEGTDNHVLVSMSRTGKSFAGILFIANEMFKRARAASEGAAEAGDECLALLVTPFHASARETSSVLSRYFGWFLRPCVLLTDARSPSTVIRLTGEVSPNVIVATPEAMRDLLRSPVLREWLEGRQVVCAVYDDVHSIMHDPYRSVALLEVSSYLAKLPSHPRVLVLSAQFDGSDRLSKVFDAKMTVDKTDYDTPDINLVNYSSTQEKEKGLFKVVTDIAEEGGTALVYMQSIDGIHEFLEKNGSALAASAAGEMDSMIRSRLQRIARVLGELGYEHSDLLAGGVAYYHGLLDETQRWFVEWALRRKYLRFLFGTESLGFGVNTPVSDVVMGATGIDEVFRQSMMARAVTLRRGKVNAGRCTVFAKSITDVSDLRRVYTSPRLPVRFINNATVSAVFIGLIGLGVIRTDKDRRSVSKVLELFYKKGSTEKALDALMKSDPPLVAKNAGDALSLTVAGNVAFELDISGSQLLAAVEGVRLLLSCAKHPTATDALMIMSYSLLADTQRSSDLKELDSALQAHFVTEYDSALKDVVIDTDHELSWHKAIEYSVLVLSCTHDGSPVPTTRKTTERLVYELRRFYPRFVGILEGIDASGMLGPSKKSQTMMQTLLKVTEEEIGLNTLSVSESKRERLSGWNLDFVDFADIERSIDGALDSDLSAAHKIQLIELLENVHTTTSALVDLMSRSQNDPESHRVLELICEHSKEGQLGENLTKALEEEGLVRPGTIGQLWKRFSTSVEQVKKRTDTPSKAAGILFSLFSGNIVGAATSSYEVLRVALSKSKGKVDTSGVV
ncbi:MAG: hypothetical protein HXY34_05340 [Candidatus Thorarchaeota archaeon]|nr:hypothetical protein [Candidatus Thorarchaeota archaeon]